MLYCPYCKQKIEKSWRYCQFCNKPLITDIERELDQKIQRSFYDPPFLMPETSGDEPFNTQVVYNEELDKRLDEIEDELRFKEQKGESIGNLLLEKSSIYFKKRDLDSALKNLENALKNFQQDQDLMNMAIAHNEIGLVYEEQGFFDQAIFHFDEALIILRKLNDFKKQVQVLNNLGNVYYLINYWNEANQRYQSAIDLSEEHHLDFELVQSSSNLVEVLFYFKEYDRIGRILNSNLTFFKEEKDFYGIIQTRIKFGKLYYHLGKDYYEQSYENMNEAIKLIDVIKDQISIYVKAKLEWECYLYLGKLNLLWDNDLESEDYFLKSLEAVRTFEITDNVKEGTVLENMGKMFSLRGEDKKAVEYYNFAREIYEKYGDKRKVATIYSLIGEIYHKYLQNFNDAFKAYNSSLNILEELELYEEIADVLINLSSIHLAKNEKHKAIENLNQAKLLLEKTDIRSKLDLVDAKLASLKDS